MRSRRSAIPDEERTQRLVLRYDRRRQHCHAQQGSHGEIETLSAVRVYNRPLHNPGETPMSRINRRRFLSSSAAAIGAGRVLAWISKTFLPWALRSRRAVVDWDSC